MSDIALILDSAVNQKILQYRPRVRLPLPPPIVETDSSGYRLVFGCGLAQRRHVSRFGRE